MGIRTKVDGNMVGVVFVCANQLVLFQVFSGGMEGKWPMASTLHTLVGAHNVVGWLLLSAS